MQRGRGAYKAAIPALKKDIVATERRLGMLKSALFSMEALAEGTEQPQRSAVLVPVEPSKSQTKPGRPRLGSKTTIDVVEEILREGGRPMHALDEIRPALEVRGHRYKHEASLISSMRKSGRFERTAPGTYALKSAVKEGRAS